MKRFNFIALLFFLPTLLISQPKDSLNIPERIEKLEKGEDILKESYKLYKEKLEIDYLDKAKKIEEQNTMMLTLIWVFGPIALVSIIAAYFSVYSRSKKYANKKIEIEIDALFKEHKGKFINLIKAVDEEQRIKILKNIIVISDSTTDENFIKRFFDTMEFKNVKFHNNTEIVNSDVFDLIFFNNLDNKLSGQYIKSFIERKPNQVYFYFGDKIDIFNERMCYANSKITIYANLMNTLKYHEVVKDDI